MINSDIGSSADVLQYALEHGMIDLPYVQEQMQMSKRKELLDQYGKGIWQGKNGKWYVKLPDRHNGKLLKKRTSREAIEDLVVEFYQNYREAIYFPDVYNKWIAEKEEYCEVEESSITRYNNDFKRFFSPDEPFCQIEIQDINSSILEQFIKRMIRDKALSAKSYAGLRTLLLGVLKYAKREGYTDFSVSNFFDDLDLPQKIFKRKSKPSDGQIFNCTEAERLLGYFETHDTLVNLGLALQFFTGLRVGELSSLKESDNIKVGILTIRRTEFTYYDKDKGARTTIVKEFPKTENSIRDVILPEQAQNIMNEIKARKEPGEYLFTQKGKRITGRMFNYYLHKGCRAVGIPERSTHKIRKTYGSLLLSNHMDEAIVLNQMGHKNISTTRSYYYYDIAKDYEKKQKINEIVRY